MKKLLFFLAAVSGLMMANAQVKLMVNGQSYEPGATIPVTVEEEFIYEMDYVTMVTINVVNEGEAILGATMTATAVDAPGYSVKSMCAGVCQEGATSPVFDIPAQGTYESVFAEFKVHPEGLAEDKKGTMKVVLNGGDNPEFFLELTYVPMNNGIDEVEMNSVKAWPNPVVSELHVACEHASEVLLMDVSGKVLQKIAVNGADEIKVDMGGYAAGIYMCATMEDGVLKGMKRVVKY